jgi:MFS family permease
MVKMGEERDEQSQVVQHTPAQGSKLLLAMVIVLHAFNHVIRGAMPVLYPGIMDEFNLGYVQLGFLQSVSQFASGFPQMLMGALRRWFSGRTLIGLGNILHSAFNMAASLVGGFYQFLALNVIAGLGSSTQHPVGSSILTTNSDPSWRGRVFGLNLSIPMLASTFSPLVAAWLMILIGWRSTMAIVAVPALIASVVLLLLVKESGDGSSRSRTFSLRSLMNALRNRNILAVSILRSVMAFRMGIRAFIPLYLINALGMATGLSSTLYSLMIFGGVVGPFFWGYLSERMGRRPLVIGILAAQSALFYILQLFEKVLILAPLLFLIGFLAQTVIMQSILADSAEKEQLDHVFGFYYTLGFTLGSVSSIIFAFVVEILGFEYGFTYISAITAICIIPAFFLRDARP